ncbi:LysR family transcriptional regulator [Ferrimonas gelatinilytica]|uniref:LysR family transcriptional regulator n=1 Tax=Ferrimonas gelatinilytica TaxID=1255257 RepID=A0ABP9S9B9_9GAMM
MFNAEQLKMLVFSAELGSFSAAARKLGKAQSAVSQGIANLEIDLDCQLFDRRGRSPVLTDAGRRLLPYAQATLGMAAGLQQAAQALASGHEEQLVLAIDEALMMPGMERILAAFAEQFPATELELQTVPSPDMRGWIQQGAADIGLMFADLEMPQELSLCYLGSVPFLVVAAEEHPLAALESVDLDACQRHRQLLVRGFDGAGLSHFPPMSAQIWWTNTFYLMRTLVLQGLGWAYLPEHLARREIRQGRLVVLPVEFDHRPWRAPVERIMLKHREPGPALAWLSQELQNLFEDR